ncbi:hypothetical protein [Nocardia ninae]|uniref:hypothetical protein n=1 Tax=Nocardia ninae TaxID=356145 RepID=UPI0031E2C195
MPQNNPAPDPSADLPYLIMGTPSVGPGKSATLPGGTTVEKGKPGDLTQTWSMPGKDPIVTSRPPTAVDTIISPQTPQESPSFLGLPDVVAIVKNPESSAPNSTLTLPSGVTMENQSYTEGNISERNTKFTGPGISPLEYSTFSIKNEPGNVLGFGTSYDLEIGADGLPQRATIHGSDSAKEVLFGSDGVATVVPLDSTKKPYAVTLVPNLTDVKVNAGNGAIVMTGEGLRTGYNQVFTGMQNGATWADRLAYRHFPNAIDTGARITSDYTVPRANGTKLPLGVGRLSGPIALLTLPLAIWGDMSSGDSAERAVIRESTGLLTGIAASAAAGAAMGTVFPGAGNLAGLAVGVTAGLVGSYLGSKGADAVLSPEFGKEPDSPPPSWLLPDDPAYLRQYIADMEAQSPTWANGFRPSPKTDSKAYARWKEWDDQRRAAQDKLAEIEKNIPRKANGGLVLGPGTSKSDSILSYISNGEFVVNSDATAEFLPLLEMLNAGWVPSAESMALMFPDLLPDLNSMIAPMRTPPVKTLEAPRFSAPLKTLELPGPAIAQPGDSSAPQFKPLQIDPDAVLGSGVKGALSGAQSGAAQHGLVGALTGGISGAASSIGGTIGSAVGTAIGAGLGPVGVVLGPVIGQFLGSMAGSKVSEIVTKPIEYVANTAKEVIGSGFGLVDLAKGPGGHTARGDIYNFNGMDPKSAAIAVERVHRRRTLAQQRGGGLGR